MATWRELVRDGIIDLARTGEDGDDTFELTQLYDRTLEQASEEFPDNDHPRAKVRQTLQRLRDDGEISFLGDGVYRRLEAASEDVESDGCVRILSKLESELDDLES